MKLARDNRGMRVKVNGTERVLHGWREAVVAVLLAPAFAVAAVAILIGFCAVLVALPAIAVADAIGQRV